MPDAEDFEDYSDDAMETDPALVAQYQKVYADDLELRLGLKKRKLPTTLSVVLHFSIQCLDSSQRLLDQV